MNIDLSEKIEAPSGVTVSTSAGNLVTVKGPKGEVARSFFDQKVHIKSAGAYIEVTAPRATKKDKTRMYSYLAHIRNMIEGVQRPHEYDLKICSGHFPINVTATANQLSVKNFLGEKTPRTVKIPAGTVVKIDGDKIHVSSPNIEIAGQTASAFEKLTRITNRDRRIFQDGIYIIKKAGESP